jgi:hypothetical protein
MIPLTTTFASNSHNAPGKIELKIDKLTLLMDLPPQDQSGMVTSFIDWKKDTLMQSEYGFAPAYGKGCCGYQVSLACRVPTSIDPLIWSKDTAFLFQVGPKKPTLPPARIDINPLGLSPAGISHLCELVEHVFKLGWMCLQQSRVSRVDAAVDLHGIKAADWLWDIPGKRARETFSNGELRTLYLGAKRHNPIVVYNKAAQIGLAKGVELTRIEFRGKYQGPLWQLPKMKNPLTKLAVIDPSLASDGLTDPLRRAFLPVGHFAGCKGILGLFPIDQQAPRQAKLMAARAPWWLPDEVWSKWPTVLEQTLPDMIAPPPKLPKVPLATAIIDPICN